MDDINKTILDDFKDGKSIESCTLTYFYNKKTKENKLTKTQAREQVEAIIYEDYMRYLRRVEGGQ